MNRRWIAISVLTAGLLATGVGGYRYYFLLPHPAQASNRDLMRWMVLRDLSQEPPAVQHALIERFSSLTIPESENASPPELSDGYRLQLETNAEYLQHAWFRLRCREYMTCPPRERIKFIKRQWQTLLTWSDLARRVEPHNDADTSGSFARFFARVERWMSRAGQRERPVMQRAVADSVLLWLCDEDLSKYSAALQLSLAESISRHVFESQHKDESPYDHRQNEPESNHGPRDQPQPGPETVEAAESGSAQDTTDAVNSGRIAAQLTEQQQQRLTSNAWQLLRVWLFQRAAEYSQLPRSERNDYVDRHLDLVSQGQLMSYVVAADSNESNDSRAALLSLRQRIDRWIAEADPQPGRQLTALVSHVQMRMLIRTLVPSRK